MAAPPLAISSALIDVVGLTGALVDFVDAFKHGAVGHPFTPFQLRATWPNPIPALTLTRIWLADRKRADETAVAAERLERMSLLRQQLQRQCTRLVEVIWLFEVI